MIISDNNRPIKISEIKPPPEDWEDEIKEFWWLVWNSPDCKKMAWKLYEEKKKYNYYINRSKYLPLSRL